MNNTAKLLLYCPDQQGILADVTNFITFNKGNIVYLDQYVDHVENVFFMRIEWELDSFSIPREKISDYFGTLYGQRYNMKYHIYFSDQKPRMAIFVSKLSHCLYDMLARYTAGEWDVKIRNSLLRYSAQQEQPRGVGEGRVGDSCKGEGRFHRSCPIHADYQRQDD